MVLAKAIYNNVADTVEELSFSPGDILTVLEQDVGGAVGWWLCSLNGRIGIVPGNRLRIVAAGETEEKPGPRDAGSSRSTPQQMSPVLARRQQNIVVPHKAGNVYVYDSTKQTLSDYDVPPSRLSPATSGCVSPSLSIPLDNSLHSDYDVPSSGMHSSKGSMTHLPAVGNVYDSPASLTCGGQSCYDVPSSLSETNRVSSSNRSSVLSVLSTGSLGSQSSFTSARSGSSPANSTRSSINLTSSDIYDTPKSATDEKTKLRRSDGPTIGTLTCVSQAAERDSLLEDYAVPREGDTSSAGSADSGISLTKSDAVSNDLYDAPKNLALPEEANVYDVPPSSSGICTEVATGQPQCSDVTNMYDKVNTDTSSANQRVAQLRDGIFAKVELFMSLVRSKQPMDSRRWCQMVIAAAVAVRSMLQELVTFGMECTVRVADSQVSKSMNDIVQELARLHCEICVCIDALTAQCSRSGCDDFSSSSSLVDAVRNITSLTPVVTEFCKFVHSNTAAVILPGKSENQFMRRGKPPPVMSKPAKSAVAAKAIDVQSRPLPPPPPAAVDTGLQSRPLPPPPATYSCQSRPLPPPPNHSVGEARPLTGPPALADNSHRHQTEPEAVSSQNASMPEKLAGQGWNEDTDYVSIAAEEAANSEMSAMRANSDLSYNVPSSCVATDTSPRIANGYVKLSTSDRELITFYAAQVNSQLHLVDSAATDFCQYVSAVHVVSPDVFVQRSKSVILAAHKLVYIGDTVARHVSDDTVGRRVADTANVLCSCLKTVVGTTKEAALGMTSPNAVLLKTRSVNSIRAAFSACKQLASVLNECVCQ